MKQLFATAALLFALGLNHSVKAEPVVIGDPSKGTPVTEIKDGNKKVKITTTGITVDQGDDGDDADAAVAAKPRSNLAVSVMSDLDDILVPLFFFLFLIAVILGKRYFDARNDERRLSLLKLMVEKGQPVPEAALNQLLAPQAMPESDDVRQAYKRTRNAYGFTLAGSLLLGYALITREWSNTGVLVPALIFLSLGLGGLAGIYLPTKQNKAAGQQ